MPTTKHLSYAGISLLLPTPELEAGWLSAIQDAYSFDDLSGWNFDTPSHDSLPTPPIPTPPDFRLNTLYWPTGASRPAWFHCVVESSRLAAIKTALGATNVAAPLVLYDSRSGKTVTAQMRMLPSRPVNVSCGDSDEQFYLLTLADDRFFWYGRRGVITTPATWADLYAQIEALLGVTLSVETVPSEYATPSAKWVTSYASTPALLDAVAAQVGQRIVVGLDGLVYAVGWETAKAAFDAYLAAADPVTTGGAVADVPRIAPELVVTTFADVSSGSLAAVPHAVTTTLASLAITEYGGATGVADDYETLYADLPYDGANATAVNDYAERAAFDYYGWLLESPDVVWPGVEPYAPTGWEDACEWTLTTRGPDDPFSVTRVRRGPWRTFAGGDYTAGLSSSFVPLTGVENSVPTYDGAGNLLSPNNTFIVPGTNAGDPNNTFTIATGDAPATDPNVTFQVNEDGGAGDPNFLFNFYPSGTGSDPNYTFETSATQTSTNITFDNSGNPISVNNTFTNSGTDEVNFLFGGTSSTGINNTFTIDPATGKVIALDTNYTFDDGGGGTVTGTVAASVVGGLATLDFSGINVTGIPGTIERIEITKSYTDVTDTDTANDIEVYSLPAGYILAWAAIKHTAQWTGTGLLLMSLNLGRTGLSGDITGTLTTSVAPSGTGQVHMVSSTGGGNWRLYNSVSATSIRLFANSSGCNLNQLTAGTVKIVLYVLNANL